MTKITYNINHNIYVRLKEEGYEILKDYHNQFHELNNKIPLVDVNYLKSKADKDGYTKFQAWHFIEIFGGDKIVFGREVPYDTNILIELNEA